MEVECSSSQETVSNGFIGWGEPDKPWKNMNQFDASFYNFSGETEVESLIDSESERMPAITSQSQESDDITGKSRNWCFTLNNPQNNCEGLDSMQKEPPFLDASKFQFPVKFMIYQLEKGESGTPHLQGYIQMNNPQSFNTMRRLFNSKASIKKAKGNKNQNIVYCTKCPERVNGPWVHTLVEAEKNVNDLRSIALNASRSKADRKLMNMMEDVKKGIEEDELLDRYGQTYVRNYKFVENYIRKITPKRNWEMFVCVIQGPTGCGKSRYVWDKHGIENVYPKMDDQWWCDYDRHETVLLDDFYGSWIKLGEFLKLLDRYPYVVRTKGSSRQFVSKNIYITTNTLPHTWYKYNFSRIERRVKQWLVWSNTQQQLIEYTSYSEASLHMTDYHVLEQAHGASNFIH